jgi:hypothetical protein
MEQPAGLRFAEALGIDIKKECLLGLLHYRHPSKGLEKADSQFP